MSTTTDRLELKPCPFCGGRASIHEVDNDVDPKTGAIRSDGGGRFVKCDGCQASSAMMFPLMESVDALLV